MRQPNPAPQSDEPTTRDRIHDLDKRIAETELLRKGNHAETNEKLDRIEELAVKTNGRVNKHDKWLWTTTGSLAVLIPLVVYLLKLWVEFESKKVLGP